MDWTENGQARLGVFPLPDGPFTSSQHSLVNAAGSWINTNSSPLLGGEDSDLSLASDSATARSRSHSRLSRYCEKKVATIKQGQKICSSDGVDDGQWNQEQASVGEPTLSGEHTPFVEIPHPLALNGNLALSPNKVSSASAKTKRKGFAKFMLPVRTWMEQHQNENVKAAVETSSTQSTHQSTQSSRRKCRAKRKQKGTDRDSSPSEDSPEKRNKFDPTSGRSSNERHRYACPFHKHDHMTRKTHTSRPVACWERGFSEIARLRQHLQRDHALWLRCTRCLRKLKDEEAMSAHKHTGCKESYWQPDDWIEEEKMKRIEEHGITWEKIFKILFEGVSVVPSPYHDLDVVISGMKYVPNMRQVDSEIYNQKLSDASSTERTYPTPMEVYDLEISRDFPTMVQTSQSIVAQGPLPKINEEPPLITLPPIETPILRSWPLDNTVLSQSTHETDDTYAHSYLGSPENNEELPRITLPPIETPIVSSWPLDNTVLSQSTHETDDTYAHSYFGSDPGFCACFLPHGTGDNCENCKGLKPPPDSAYGFET